MGIPEDKKDLIFERFFQASTTAAILNQGTGIGLSITKEFIKMHGGAINVESEPGKGAVFFIQLPLTTVRGREPELLHQQPETPSYQEDLTLPAGIPVIRETPARTADMPLVLLVEDNEDFRFYLKDNLGNRCKVIEAANGKEGWQKATCTSPRA